MSFATNMQATASRLLTAYGQTVTFSRTTQGTFVPSTGAVGAGSSSTYTAKVHPKSYTAQEVDKISVLTGDVLLLVYSTTAVLVGDTVSLDAVVYRVLNVEKINVQGSNVIYKAQVRA